MPHVLHTGVVLMPRVGRIRGGGRTGSTVTRHLLLAVIAVVAMSILLPARSASAQAVESTSDDAATATEAEWFTACHWTGTEFRLISFPVDFEIPQWRIDAHIGHGDRWPGDNVPGGDWPGYYLDSNCQPVSWLVGVTFGGCMTEATSETPCFRPGPGGPGSTLVYDPSGTQFTALTAVVQNPGVEFTTASRAVTADFDGDYLTITVAPGQPELDFYFGFGPWDLFDTQQTSDSTLGSLAQSGPGELLLRTASTEGATLPLVARYRLRLAHSYGFSEFRDTTITVDPPSLAADGTSTATVTVQLKNAVGEIAEGDIERVVDLFVDPEFATLSDTTYHGDGRYTATLTAGTQAGTTQIFGQVNYLVLDLAVGEVTFTAPPPLPIAGP